MKNVLLAFRSLRRTPFVTTMAVVSLGLGIGANTAVFSAFNQLLLRSVSAPEPDRLVNLSAPGPKPGSQSCGDAGPCEVVFSYPMFRDLERTQASFTGVAAHRNFGTSLAYKRRTETGVGLFVSGSYFPVLGVRPALGRLLGPSDDQVIGGHPVAVLGFAYWQNRLGGDSSVLNQQILVGGHPMTIVGVAPPGFEGTSIGARLKVYIPLSMRSVVDPTFRDYGERRSYWLYLFARLKPGVSIERAAVAINEIYHPIIRDVEAPLQQGMSPETLEKFREKEIGVVDGRRGQSTLAREAKAPLVLLLAVTLIVLLIACANIINLLLARAADRSTELAVRLSLGATRGQLVAQLLAESFVLAALGGVVSIAVAYWTISGIVGLLPGEVATSLQLTLQPAAIWFAATVALGTGLLFGIIPALLATRPDLDAVLRAGSGKISGARTANRLRSILATAQIALSMALLMSAGLFLRSLQNVSRIQFGLQLDNVATFSVAPVLNAYAGSRSAALFTQIETALAGLPGVTSASATAVPLLAGDFSGSGVSVQGFTRGPDTDAVSAFNEIGAGYFKTVGIQLIAGREFTTNDAHGAAKVAIVNETFAKKFGLGRDAVGKFMGTGRDSLDIQIVGLVKDAKYSEVKDPVPPVFFTPIRQDTTVGQAWFYVRTQGAPDAALREIPGLIAQIDPNLPVTDLRTMRQQVRENVYLDSTIGTLSSMFALLATLLASVGLYGVLAYSVAQRTREIGVRMALGADRATVRRMVFRQVGLMIVVGAPVGIAGAIGLARIAGSVLFELRGTDPVVMLMSSAVLTIVALGSGYVPALRASRIEPMQALRNE